MHLFIHSIKKINNTWIGVYDSLKNRIIYNNKFYTSLSGFTSQHYQIEMPNRTNRSNGWSECEYEVNGEWISTYDIKFI